MAHEGLLVRRLDHLTRPRHSSPSAPLIPSGKGQPSQRTSGSVRSDDEVPGDARHVPVCIAHTVHHKPHHVAIG